MIGTTFVRSYTLIEWTPSLLPLYVPFKYTPYIHIHHKEIRGYGYRFYTRHLLILKVLNYISFYNTVFLLYSKV